MLPLRLMLGMLARYFPARPGECTHCRPAKCRPTIEDDGAGSPGATAVGMLTLSGPVVRWSKDTSTERN